MGVLMTAALEKQFGDGSGLIGSGFSSLSTGFGSTSRRSRESLLNLYSVHPWVRLAEEVVAARQSAAEWFLLLPGGGRRDSTRRRIMQAPFVTDFSSGYAESPRDRVVKIATAAGEVEEFTDHPFLTMMAQGTAGAPSWMDLSGHQVDKLETITLDLVGEWVQVLFRDPVLGIPVRWWPIPTTWVRPPDQHRSDFEIRIRNGGLENIPPEDVWFYRHPRPLDPYGIGTGRVGAADHDVQQDESMAQYLNALLRNRARPDLLVAMRGLGQTQAEKFQEEFRQSSSGPQRAGVTHFIGVPIDPDLKGEFVTVKDLSRSPADLEVSQQQIQKRDAILQVIGVPQSVIGATESSNRAVAHQGEVSLRRNRTVPDLESRRNALQTRFFDQRGSRPPEYPGGWILAYRLPQLLDIETLTALLTANPEQYLENDHRRAASLAPIEGGDERRWIDSGQLAVNEDQIGELLEIFRGEGSV